MAGDYPLWGDEGAKAYGTSKKDYVLLDRAYGDVGIENRDVKVAKRSVSVAHAQ